MAKGVLGAVSGFFSADSKIVIFHRNDSLNFYELKSGFLSSVANVTNYKRPVFGKGHWLAYQLSNSKNELILRDLSTGKERIFDFVSDYDFDESGIR